MASDLASGPVSLLDEARALNSRKGPQCDVDRFYTYHPELAGELRQALAADIPSTAIAIALKRRGIEISAHTLQRHRREACKCRF